ncbi:MAG: hypothetical protein IIY80_03075, partial [Aeriscardovia sp.]|nr:hypothetical protein [Aeriscardovia sp.]
VFFKSAKRMKKSVDQLLSSIHIDPICADPPSSKRKTSIERPLEESVEEYAKAHAALEKRKREKRLELMRRFIEEVE